MGTVQAHRVRATARSFFPGRSRPSMARPSRVRSASPSFAQGSTCRLKSACSPSRSAEVRPPRLRYAELGLPRATAAGSPPKQWSAVAAANVRRRPPPVGEFKSHPDKARPRDSLRSVMSYATSPSRDYPASIPRTGPVALCRTMPDSALDQGFRGQDSTQPHGLDTLRPSEKRKVTGSTPVPTTTTMARQNAWSSLVFSRASV
jgi:hypothetical protein